MKTPSRRDPVPLLCLLWTLVLISLVLTEGVTAARSSRRRGRQRAHRTTGKLGYQRFHANDTFVGKPIPCTGDEKICFRYNLVLDTDSDTCQAVGEGYVANCILRVDKKEFEDTSGRVFGVCQSFEDPCPGYRMAYDGRCYTPEVVRNVICGCDAQPTRHILGNMECRCSTPTPVEVEQPREAGRCKIPDLRFPDKERSQFRESYLRSVKLVNPNCSAEQRKCFAEEKVWVAEAKGCFPLLKRGPCKKDEVVVFTKENWTNGAAVCMQIRGNCFPGYIRMAFDGQCHQEREMMISAPGRLSFNILGEYEVFGYSEAVTYTPKMNANACTFGLRGVSGPNPHRHYPKPTCSGTEPQCALFDTYDVPPNPE